jgi:hypothetical protein
MPIQPLAQTTTLGWSSARIVIREKSTHEKVKYYLADALLVDTPQNFRIAGYVLVAVSSRTREPALQLLTALGMDVFQQLRGC